MNEDILDPDVWKYDLQNRGYVVTEIVNGSLTEIIVTLDSEEVERIEAIGREGIWACRVKLEGGESLLPIITTTQRDTITFKAGHQIFNTTLGTAQIYDGTAWT